MFGSRRRFIPSSMPFRPARQMDEAMRMQDALDMAVGTGNDALAREIADAIRASSVDPQVVGIRRALRAIEGQPMEVLPQRTFEDMGQEIGASVRSYDGMRSGRTGNLNNQWRGDIAGREIRAAAEEGIQSAREARAAEQMGRAAATAGAGGLAAMIADSMDRMTPSAPGIRGVQSEAVDMEPLADYPMESASVEDPIRAVAMDLDPTQIDSFRDDPMATADLVAESRPIPDDTPMIAIEEAVASETPARGAMTAEQYIAQVMGDMKAQTAQLNDLRRKRAITPEQDRMLSDEIARMAELVNEARTPQMRRR